MNALFTISGTSKLVTNEAELEQLVNEATANGVTHTVSHL